MFDSLITIVQFILVLGLLLFFHEFGHYIMARLGNIHVEEFGFGFPPRLVKLFNWRGTDFTLNWIPFGAFVRPSGENDPDVPGGLGAASPWVRLGVFLGGPVMNLLIGVILFTFMFMRLGAPNEEVVIVTEVAASSPAAAAGLQPGDVILTLAEQKIDSMERMQAVTQANLGQEISLEYQRGEQSGVTSLTPRENPPEGQGPVGIAMSNPMTPVSIGEAIPLGARFTYEQIRQFVLLPVNLIRGDIRAEEARPVGPFGIFTLYSQVRQRDIEAQAAPDASALPAINVLMFTASISVALGMTNLLPIPALDGGRILFILPEIILRRRVPARYENVIHLIGMAALLLLMGWITLQDIINPVVLP